MNCSKIVTRPRMYRWLPGALATLLACAACPAVAPAQDDPAKLDYPVKHDYPAKLVTIVVPYPAGGLGDILPRAVAEVLGRQMGITFIVDNKPGATQMIGTRIAARAKPDGATLLFGSVTSLAINPSVKRELPYDPVKDFAPISLTFVSPQFLVTRRDLPASSIQELIALAKREPGTLTYASGGAGSSSHLAGELFKTMTGTDMVHVPYTGTGPAVRDVIGGHVDLTYTGSGMTYAEAGEVKVLGVTSATRALAAPAVPTIAEAGVPGYQATIWFGFLAPAGTPEPIVERLSREIKTAVVTGALRERLKASATEIELVGSTPDEFRDFIAKEIPQWRAVIKTANIPME
jgi:tripartite-type tricarboxylate transporter receptor subunit TctC